jgi:hypothetical protein
MRAKLVWLDLIDVHAAQENAGFSNEWPKQSGLQYATPVEGASGRCCVLPGMTPIFDRERFRM